jgi:hypothetical protein
MVYLRSQLIRWPVAALGVLAFASMCVSIVSAQTYKVLHNFCSDDPNDGFMPSSRSLSGIDSAEVPNITAFPEGVWA